MTGISRPHGPVRSKPHAYAYALAGCRQRTLPTPESPMSRSLKR